MGARKTSSMVLDNLGDLSIVTGSINVGAGTDAVLTCNDPSTTLATAAVGVFTLTFGQAFLSTPTIVCNPVTAGATNAAYITFVSSAATGGCVLNYSKVDGTTVAAATTTGAATTDKILFTAIGQRNR